MEHCRRPVLLFLGIYIFSLQWILSQQVNVAVKGIATQSSLWTPGYEAKRAIDGNRVSTLPLMSCAVTAYQTNPWWRVDLLDVFHISTVSITYRVDCCPQQIHGAEIRIGNSLVNNGNSNPRCAVISVISGVATVTYTCHMMGRYVNVILPNAIRHLTLCEVEVYVPVTLRAFLRVKFSSSEDLTNPNIRDKVLQMMKSANVQPSAFHLRWSKEPELETET